MILHEAKLHDINTYNTAASGDFCLRFMGKDDMVGIVINKDNLQELQRELTEYLKKPVDKAKWKISIFNRNWLRRYRR